jgi:hypothetical protein
MTLILDWYRVDDKDIAASYEEFVFRLRKEGEIIKLKHHDNETVTMMKLQVRKKQNVDFKDLGYKFLIKDGYYVNRNNYVDGIIWTDINDIASRAEEILIGLDFIDSDTINQHVPSTPEVLRAAAKGFIRALYEKQYLRNLVDYQESELENILVRTLSFWENKEPIELEEDEIRQKIRLKEFEIEFKTLMIEPQIYYVGNWRELFYTQSYLHNEDWLNEELEEELEERKKIFIENSKSSSFITEKFKVNDNYQFEYLMGRYGLNYWKTESNTYWMGSTEQDFDTFVEENEDLWSKNFIDEIQNVIDDTIVLYSVSFYERPIELGETMGPLAVQADFHIISNNEYHRITLEESASKKLKSLQRKWAKVE